MARWDLNPGLSKSQSQAFVPGLLLFLIMLNHNPFFLPILAWIFFYTVTARPSLRMATHTPETSSLFSTFLQSCVCVPSLFLWLLLLLLYTHTHTHTQLFEIETSNIPTQCLSYGKNSLYTNVRSPTSIWKPQRQKDYEVPTPYLSAVMVRKWFFAECFPITSPH